MAKRKYVKENNLVKAINTDSLELQKPLVNEYYDINVHNSNMDKIDAGYKQNKNDISNINYELSKVENTKYATKNGIKEFNCKDGYIDNVTIEGETLVNLVRNDLKIHIWYGDRCVIDLVNCGYLKGTYTIFNFSNKKIYQDIGVAGDAGTWLKGITIEPCQSIAFDIVEGEQLSYVSCAFIDGWENTDTSITEFRESIVLLEGDHTDKPISYFEGLASVGQGDKIEVVSCINNIYSDINKTVGKILNGEGVLVDYPTHDCSDYIVIEPNSIYYTNIPHGFIVYDANKIL